MQTFQVKLARVTWTRMPLKAVPLRADPLISDSLSVLAPELRNLPEPSS